MRVLFVISGLGLGGAERQVVLLSKELVKRGHNVSIYTLTRETPRIDELEGTHVDVRVDQKNSRLDPSVIKRLRRHIQSWRPQIVHGFLYDGDLYARLAACGLDIPVLNSERNDNYVLSLAQRVGYRITSMLCDGIVANSFAGAAFARSVHRVRDEDVHVVWNGIDLHEIDARLARGERPAQEIFSGRGIKRVCMVGSIKPQKDYLLALRVARRLVDEDPSWRVICVGDALSDGAGDYKTDVLNELHRLRLDHFVKFVGHRRDVPEIIGSSDLLLITSTHEGFPNVVLEAMACGTAVVSTDYSDVRRILPMETQIVGSRLASDIAKAVVRCHTLRNQIVPAQRRWVEAHGTAGASAVALLGIYSKYLESPARVTADTAC
jgi:glycosyltransferase involved in cell wall biosynthesis